LGVLKIRRIYLPPEPDDGRRVLVDRLCPRGVARGRAALGAWEKDLAPSAALRQWFGHEPEKYPEFRRRYLAELAENPAAAAFARECAAALAEGNVTLLFAARDERLNNAAALRDYLAAALQLTRQGE